MASSTNQAIWAQNAAMDMVSLRHDLHQHPELSFQEFRTQEVILQELRKIGLNGTKIANTGVVATILGNRPGKTVALRADMDALPMPDESQLPYASINDGICHACGHDAHIAILIGAAQTLMHDLDFAGQIRLVFQPAEEQLPGGAQNVLASGILDDVDAIFGLHVWQPLAFGQVATSKGALMAAPDDFSLLIKGRGGHASMPEMTIDPVVVAAHIVTALQTLVSRYVSANDQVVLSVTQMHTGTAMNVIPEWAQLQGTLRTLSPKIRDEFPKKMEQLATQIAQAFGAQAKFTVTRGYPALINNPSMAEFALATAADLFGEAQAILSPPTMGGEDFAYYLEKIPGAFVWLGMGTPYPHHHPKFDARDDILYPGIRLLTELALRFLE